ncbi:MAG: hypothetical protein HON70_04640, partial [Lentisphaerae bacterium]|nr:hypothetical protein [Lentisphaerota bacterium]
MTLRSIILGLLGGSAICAFSFFNDRVVNQQMLVPHQLPPIVYGALIVGVLLSGLACRHLGKRRGITASEWAVIAALWLVACGIPGWGLMECVPPTAIMTHHYAQVEPGWRSGAADVVATVPEQMLVNVDSDDGTVLNGYVCGLAQGDQHIPIRAVPWGSWAKTVTFWLPFVLALTIGMFGLAAVVHRQWSEHESLPYPISTFAHALLPGDDGTVAVLRAPLFWVGAAPILLMQLNNYLAQWFPVLLIPIRLRVDLSSLYVALPFLNGPGFSYQLSFAVLGLAYFLRTNVAFSVGVVPYLYTAIALVLGAYGVSLSGGDHLGGNYNTFLFAGGYLGVFMLMLYTGRHYYRNALHQGLLFPAAGATPATSTRQIRAALVGVIVAATLLLVCRTGWLWALPGGVAAGLLHSWAAPRLTARGPVDQQAVWGMRVFIAGILVFLALLVSLGLDWQLAVLFAAITVVTFVVVSRAVAETGAFLFGTFFLPGALLLGFAGAVAIGPRTALTMALASSAILLAPGWAPMPFMVQALKLADMAKADVHKTAKCGIAVLLLCAPLALAVTLYWSYDRGAPIRVWPHAANQYPGRDMVRMTARLQAQGMLDTAASVSGWERLPHLSPNRPQVVAFVIAAALTVLCGWCGLRLTKWPFHPVMFLFLGSFHGQWISVSLLAGCAVKAGVIRYGGADLYNRVKPLMVGFIAGSVVAATIPTIVGGVYYLAT